MSSVVNEARTTEMEDRETSPNEPENAANPRKVLKMSSFVHETRAQEKEDQRRFPQRTQLQLPGMCRKCLRS